LPPLVGFAGKFQVFEALYEAGRVNPTLATWSTIALGVAVLNTAISAGYYLKVLKVSFLDEPEEGAKPIAAGFSAKLFLGLLTIAIVVLGVAWNPVVQFTTRAVAGMG
jgi:NADH-quinone oxidoreductase subunit N